MGNDSESCSCLKSNMGAGTNRFFIITDYLCATHPSIGHSSRSRNRISLRICFSIKDIYSFTSVGPNLKSLSLGPRFWRGLGLFMAPKSRHFHEISTFLERVQGLCKKLPEHVSSSIEGFDVQEERVHFFRDCFGTRKSSYT